jgi:hypothetical protein
MEWSGAAASGDERGARGLYLLEWGAVNSLDGRSCAEASAGAKLPDVLEQAVRRAALMSVTMRFRETTL